MSKENHEAYINKETSIIALPIKSAKHRDLWGSISQHVSNVANHEYHGLKTFYAALFSQPSIYIYEDDVCRL